MFVKIRIVKAGMSDGVESRCTPGREARVGAMLYTNSLFFFELVYMYRFVDWGTCLWLPSHGPLYEEERERFIPLLSYQTLSTQSVLKLYDELYM